MYYRVAILVVSLLGANAFASVWRPLDDKEFTVALAHGTEIANSKTAVTSFPYVRIYSVPETIAECSGTLESCPDWRIYIAISMSDPNEEPFLFKFPIESKGWAFSGWRPTDKLQTVVFRIETVLPSANLDSEVRRDWKPEVYEIAVTPNGATVSPIIGGDEPSQ